MSNCVYFPSWGAMGTVGQTQTTELVQYFARNHPGCRRGKKAAGGKPPPLQCQVTGSKKDLSPDKFWSYCVPHLAISGGKVEIGFGAMRKSEAMCHQATTIATPLSPLPCGLVVVGSISLSNCCNGSDLNFACFTPKERTFVGTLDLSQKYTRIPKGTLSKKQGKFVTLYLAGVQPGSECTPRFTRLTFPYTSVRECPKLSKNQVVIGADAFQNAYCGLDVQPGGCSLIINGTCGASPPEPTPPPKLRDTLILQEAITGTKPLVDAQQPVFAYDNIAAKECDCSVFLFRSPSYPSPSIFEIPCMFGFNSLVFPAQSGTMVELVAGPATAHESSTIQQPIQDNSVITTSVGKTSLTVGGSSNLPQGCTLRIQDSNNFDTFVDIRPTSGTGTAIAQTGPQLDVSMLMSCMDVAVTNCFGSPVLGLREKKA